MAIVVLLLAVGSVCVGLCLLLSCIVFAVKNKDEIIKEDEPVSPDSKMRDYILSKAAYQKRKMRVIRKLLENNPDYLQGLVDEKMFNQFVKHILRKTISDTKYKMLKECMEKGEPIPGEFMADFKIK